VSTAPLFLVTDLPPGESIELTGDEGRHAARVKRLSVGEPVLVSDGRGSVAECTVAATRADGLELAVTARRSVPRAEPRLVVVQALPKGDRAELAVEILTELGADEIVPWAASRSIVQWLGPRGDRALTKWRRTAREAAKQSRRVWLPDVAPLASTAEVAARLAGATGLVLHEGAESSLASVELPPGRDIVVVVGPEGGIAPDELDDFCAVGAHAVRLGEPVLRTSTAGAAALAVLSARLGRWA
jgi:16S rRNA (uracil1498-N3)-methyltransferase